MIGKISIVVNSDRLKLEVEGSDGFIRWLERLKGGVY